MSKLDKIHVLVVLFILLVLVLVVNPSIVKNMYSSFLGRILLVFIVIFFAMNNMTLGLLTALVFIIFSNMILMNQEGLETMENENIENPLDNTTNPSKENKKDNNNIDMETIKDSLKALSSTTIPDIPKTTTDDVEPAAKENFQSMYASF